MSVICVATTDGRAYYAILSRLKKTGLEFKSVKPSSIGGCDLVLTTKRELSSLGGVTVAIEDLDENPSIMKGQILSRIKGGMKKELLVGIDPGSRIGVAVFYQNVKLASLTFNSATDLIGDLKDMVRRIPHSKLSVKIGDGAPNLSDILARGIRGDLKEAVIEIIDEKGTSSSYSTNKLMTRDQFAAAKIAFRKGMLFTS